MPAATCKTDLIAICDKEYAKLARLIAPLSDATATAPGAEGVSIKDTVAHRAHWITLYLGWVSDGRAGAEVQTPAPGYKWSELKAYNAQLRAAQAGLSWAEAQADLAAEHARLMAFLAAESDESLYTPHLMPWMNDWTLGRWAEASGASHYRSAAKFIRKTLRDQASAAAEAPSQETARTRRD
ncbi:ClbS/DfsB family four-helix bundle protein [Dinoroseobacter sp. S124A]|uniref:ClbS/DfsB family four-helix bundle protein n=1 Tax=Dinoroseobacter sp. S124A TaxID=3415128 RepID=UPI003C7BC91E